MLQPGFGQNGYWWTLGSASDPSLVHFNPGRRLGYGPDAVAMMNRRLEVRQTAVASR